MANDSHVVSGKHKSVGYITFDIFIYVFFGLFTLVCAYPFYYLIIN